jgi:hypothetical protein
MARLLAVAPPPLKRLRRNRAPSGRPTRRTLLRYVIPVRYLELSVRVSTESAHAHITHTDTHQYTGCTLCQRSELTHATSIVDRSINRTCHDSLLEVACSDKTSLTHDSSLCGIASRMLRASPSCAVSACSRGPLSCDPVEYHLTRGDLCPARQVPTPHYAMAPTPSPSTSAIMLDRA